MMDLHNVKSWKMTLPDGTTIDSDNLKISSSDNYTQPHIPIPSISIEGTIKVKKRGQAKKLVNDQGID